MTTVRDLTNEWMNDPKFVHELKLFDEKEENRKNKQKKKSIKVIEGILDEISKIEGNIFFEENTFIEIKSSLNSILNNLKNITEEKTVSENS